MKNPYNDLKKIDIPHLRSMINAFSADYGRFLSIEEYTDNKKAITRLQIEIDSRQKVDTIHNIIFR